MTVADTSVLVAAFATWHEHHEVAVGALARTDALVAHVAFETVSVLSRMPEPYRVTAAAALEFLDSWYPGRPLVATAAQAQKSLREFVASGVSGGQVYDALVARTARIHGHGLLSLDRRASGTYARLGVPHELLR